MKSASLQTGQQVGEYRIEKLLGFGGMAEVYLATDLRLERTVALKLLPPELARDESLYARFEREESVPFNFLQLDNCAFLRIARCGAASLAVAILSLPLLTPGIIIKSLTDFVPLYAVGCLMSAIELPFCCGFIGPCRRIQGCLRPIEIYWMPAATMGIST